MSTRAGYRKKSIPQAVRREVAVRYGCPPGEQIEVRCAYCPTTGVIHWWRHYSGKPSAWVSFTLTLDHVIPEFLGGPSTADNLVLACGTCNRRKGARL